MLLRCKIKKVFLVANTFKGKAKGTDKNVFMIVTYELPIISARAIPQQIDFFNTHIGELTKF